MVFFSLDLHALIKPVKNPSQNLQEIKVDFNHESIGMMYITQVPRNKPLTRKQFFESQKYWNCSFHEDKKYLNVVVL